MANISSLATLDVNFEMNPLRVLFTPESELSSAIRES